jgi:hypothetical protein
MKELIKFKVKDGDKDVEFSFMEPNKAIFREAHDVNSIVYARCMRKGYLTAQEVAKIYTERGGVLTKEEQEDYLKCVADYKELEKQLELPENKGNETLIVRMADAKNRFIQYYSRQEDVFVRTAERQAREETLWFYGLALVFKDGKPFFDGSDYESRQKKFDENTTPLKEEVLKRGIWYATAYVNGMKLEDSPYPEPKVEAPKTEEVSTQPVQ